MDICNLWSPRHPQLRDALPDFLDPTLKQALAHEKPQTLLDCVEAVHSDLYTLRLLTEEACGLLNDEIMHLERWAVEHDVELQRPNSMNMYGVILEQIGYASAMTALLEIAIDPLASVLFPEVGGETLDQHHSFVVSYSLTADRDLGFHADDSEVTVNLCLGDRFEGGELYFRGRRCHGHMQDVANPDELFEVAHTPGVALLHAGLHRHGAYPISSGERHNLIVWCRSSTYRNAQAMQGKCALWCGGR